jgi:predicted nucleic acid-binding protein
MAQSDEPGRRTTIADTSVLLNYLGLGRLDLLTGLRRRIVVTPEVNEEVKRSRAALDLALAAGEISLESPPLGPEDAAIFTQLTRRLSLGDASCIAAARVLGADLATDDRATQRAAAGVAPESAILGSEALLAEAVQSGLLTLADGDALLSELVKLRYRPKVASLRELLGDG